MATYKIEGIGNTAADAQAQFDIAMGKAIAAIGKLPDPQSLEFIVDGAASATSKQSFDDALTGLGGASVATKSYTRRAIYELPTTSVAKLRGDRPPTAGVGVASARDRRYI